MTNLIPPADVATICTQIEATPGLGRLRGLLGADIDTSPEVLQAILEEASRFSDGWIGPLGPQLDRAGCRLEDGRVRTAPGHAEAWRAYLEAGWLGIDQPPEA